MTSSYTIQTRADVFSEEIFSSRLIFLFMLFIVYFVLLSYIWEFLNNNDRQTDNFCYDLSVMHCCSVV